VKQTSWKIGELAEKTGITKRTLHHYHEKGLLIPSGSTESGYRMYSKDDIIRLQQIISLKQFNFSLEEIKIILEKRNYDPVKIIKAQIQTAEKEIKRQTELKSQLETVLTIMLNKESSADDFIKLIGVFTMNTNDFFTKGQIEEMISKKGMVSLDEKMDGILKFKNFMNDLQFCYENKLPADDSKAKEVVSYWHKMTGSLGDLSSFEKLRTEKASLLAGFDVGKTGKSEIFEYLQGIAGT
jgi:DNA-binding transcriptional MerR regulator